MSRMVYVVGAPGVGKSTLVGNLKDELGYSWDGEPLLLAGKVLWGTPLRGPTSGVYLGKIHAQFPGTDRLSMEVSPEAVAWIQSTRVPPFVIGEGARLGTKKFLSVAAVATKLTVVHLTAELDELDHRCQLRGSNQAASFRKSMATQARTATAAAAEAGARVIEIDTTELDPADVADAVSLLL